MENQVIEKLRHEAENGNGDACFQLYQEYKTGSHVETDEVIALEWLEKALDKEHPIAQLIMGLSYLNAGRVKDAIDYLTLSCNQKNADALNILGQLYIGNVSGIKNAPIDKPKGVELLFDSACQGNVYAQLTVGKCFMTGNGTRKNKFFAKHWLEKASMQGNAEAAALLDECEIATTLLN